MLNKFLFTKIEEEDIDKIWFQQDSATCHTFELYSMFFALLEERIISRRADVVEPSRSWDLTQLNCYLWGASKISVTPTSLRQLTF